MTKVTESSPGEHTERRKVDHIRINLEENVQFPRLTTGLERYRFIHDALPELNLAEIDLSVSLMGKRLNSPILISSMTGGTQMAEQLNFRLAEIAQEMKLAMGVGSQRAAIEDTVLAESFRLRRVARDTLLFANIGVVQFNYGYGVDQCRKAVEMLAADALYLHFNVLQEAVQPEGDTNFAGLLKKIEQVVKQLEVPVIAKEVGWGFSEKTARALASVGVQYIDVAGAGGTSWSEVEYHRAPTEFHRQVARSFADWGIPTAESLVQVRNGAPNATIFASGGLRDGIDVAKCIALGATLGGLASPFLKAATVSVDAIRDTVNVLQRQLQIAMLCSGAKNIQALQQTPLVCVD
jgi:isopentenyl-diphosphate delta-isomerase